MSLLSLLRTVFFYIKSTYYCYVLFYIERWTHKLLRLLPKSMQPTRKSLDDSVLPLHKVNKNLEACLHEEKNAGKKLYDKFFVLITTGSLSPVHKMHTEMLEATKKHINRNVTKSKVIGGFLSACHDEYVSYKLPKEYIKGEHRYQMTKLAVKDSDFIDVDAWEIKGTRLRMFSEVAIHLADYFKEGDYSDRYPLIAQNKDRIRICFVCGSDVMILYRNYGLTFSKDVGVACVCRPFHTLPNAEERIKQHKRLGVELFIVEEPQSTDVSSTKIRQVISQALREDCEKESKTDLRKELGEFCHPQVVEYMIEHVVHCK